MLHRFVRHHWRKHPWSWWWPQLLLVLLLFSLALFFGLNLSVNYSSQNIASGLSFLEREAGFEISESLVSYASDSSYARALYVGLLNTLKVAVLGNVLALFLGLILGLCLLASWRLPAWATAKWTQFIRNVPLLLQLLFWYALFSDIFPGLRQAWHWGDWLYVCNRGVYMAHSQHAVFLKIFLFAGAGTALASYVMHARVMKVRQQTGRYQVWWPKSVALFVALALIVLAAHQWQLAWQVPVIEGFNFVGGMHLTPEYASLLLGLVLYTSAFIADIVRAAIQSVDKGQREAALSLGLHSWQIMGLVILPQSLRVMVPPLVGQILNLTKNSTLAVAIAYPDFVSVANTTLNQTGQAVELMGMIMGVYLIFSLVTSWVMNIYNRRYALRGDR